MDPPPGSDPSALPSPGSSGQETRDPLAMRTSINHLPDDILLEIFSRLPCQDLILACRLVCLRWRELADSAVLWKRKFDQWKKSPPKTRSFTCHLPEDFYILGRLKRNLIKNPCGEEGMDFWETGTSSEGQWEIQTIPEEEVQMESWTFDDPAINKCFSASKGLCVKSQRITLKDHGYWEDLMDTARPLIEVEDLRNLAGSLHTLQTHSIAWVWCPYWFFSLLKSVLVQPMDSWVCSKVASVLRHFACSSDSLCSDDDNYQLTVKLLSADNQVLQENCTQGRKYFTAWQSWRKVSHTFNNYPSGVRHILFQHQGGGMDGSDPKRDTRVTGSSIVVLWMRPRSYNESFDSDDYYDWHDCYNSSDEEDDDYYVGRSWW